MQVDHAVAIGVLPGIVGVVRIQAKGLFPGIGHTIHVTILRGWNQITEPCPVARQAAVLCQCHALESVSETIGISWPRKLIVIGHFIFRKVSDKTGIWIRKLQWFIRPYQTNGFPGILEFTRVRAQNFQARGNLIFGTECLWIGFNDQQNRLGGHDKTIWKSECHSSHQFPGVVWIQRVIEWHDLGRSISDFNVFVAAECRMIHDTAENDRSDIGSCIGSALTIGEDTDQLLRVSVAKVGSQCLMIQRGPPLGSIRVSAHGSTIFRGGKFHRVRKGHQSAIRIGLGQIDLISKGGTQGKRCERILNEKLVLVSYMKSHRGNLRPHGDAIFLQVVHGITQIPATNIDGLSSRVVELDGIFKRRVGMTQDFIDQHSGRPRIIAASGRSMDGAAGHPMLGLRWIALQADRFQ